MEVVNVHVAKTGLSRLLARVEAGEEVVIARDGRPVARLVPFVDALPTRVPGRWKGQIVILPEFYEPMDEGDLAAFEGP